MVCLVKWGGDLDSIRSHNYCHVRQAEKIGQTNYFLFCTKYKLAPITHLEHTENLFPSCIA